MHAINIPCAIYRIKLFPLEELKQKEEELVYNLEPSTSHNFFKSLEHKAIITKLMISFTELQFTLRQVGGNLTQNKSSERFTDHGTECKIKL